MSKAYELTATQVIKNLKKRGMEGFYCETRDDALKQALALINEGDSVAWGGSVTLDETGIRKALIDGPYDAIIRENAKTDEEKRALKGRIATCDAFFMSSNAVTLDGELVNIDGAGSRLSYLIYGPEKVIVVVGMNKLVKDVDEAKKRIRVHACPPNGVRLGLDTPCAKTGVCAECFSPQCMCASIVETRFSRFTGRINVILVGESLGY